MMIDFPKEVTFKVEEYLKPKSKHNITNEKPIHKSKHLQHCLFVLASKCPKSRLNHLQVQKLDDRKPTHARSLSFLSLKNTFQREPLSSNHLLHSRTK